MINTNKRIASLLLALVLTLGLIPPLSMEISAAGLGLSVSETSLDFGEVIVGYGQNDVPAQTVTLEAEGNNLYDPNVRLEDTAHFRLEKSDWDDDDPLLSLGIPRAVRVQPVADLAADTYATTLVLEARSQPGQPSDDPYDISISIPVRLKVDIVRPPAPQLKTATGGDRQVKLTWSKIDYAETYRIYVDGVLNSSDIPGLTHMATGLSNGKSYSFTVRAVREGVESLDSNALTAAATGNVPAPTAVPVLQGSAGNGELYLNWPQVEHASIYRLEYTETIGGVITVKTKDIIDGSTHVQYTLDGLTNGITYTNIRVYGYNIAGKGGYSNTLALTPIQVAGGWMPEDSGGLILINDAYLNKYASKSAQRTVIALPMADTKGLTTIVVNTATPFVLAGNRPAGYSNLAVTCHKAGVDLTVKNLTLTSASNHGIESNWGTLSSPSALHFLAGDNTLTLEGASSFTGSGSAGSTASGYGAAVGVPEGVGLTIRGAGSLTAVGGDGAGIGGGCYGTGGAITIAGGTVTATGNNSAGIGGGLRGAGGTIAIAGGTVTATGGWGAGIGGGSYSAGGTITISGGTVKADSTSYSAGIGGGHGGAGGTIAITGGTVKATGILGAGIGGGGGTHTINGGSGGDITISGGTVNATSGFGAGIGGGGAGDSNDNYAIGGSSGRIVICGGAVTAKCAVGVDIGGGYSTNISGTYGEILISSGVPAGTFVGDGNSKSNSKSPYPNQRTINYHADDKSISLVYTTTPVAPLPAWLLGYDPSFPVPDPVKWRSADNRLRYTPGAAVDVGVADLYAGTGKDPYTMGVDNYRFNNSARSFGYGSGYRIPLARYQTLFGNSAGVAGLYQSVGPWGGSCFGFSVSDLAFFDEDISPAAYQSGATSIYSLPAPGSPAAGLTQLFELLQISQYASVISQEMNVNNKNQATALVKAVQAFQEGKSADGIVLGVMSKTRGGHAVVPYAVEHKGGDNYEIAIYDNNWPDDENRKLFINSATGAWSYELWSGLLFGSESSDYFGYAYYWDVFALVDRYAGITGETNNMMLSVPRDAQVRNSGGDAIEAIPGAYENLPMSLMPDAGLPANRIYTVPMGQYRTTPGSGANEASFFDDDHSFTAKTDDRSAVIESKLGDGAFIRINSGGSNTFEIAFNTGNTVKNPLVLSGTVPGAMTAYAVGDGLRIQGGDATITVSNGSRIRDYALTDGIDLHISYNLGHTTKDRDQSDSGGSGGSATGFSAATEYVIDQAEMRKLIAAAESNGWDFTRSSSGLPTTVKAEAWALPTGRFVARTMAGNAVQVQLTFPEPNKIVTDRKVSGWVKGSIVDNRSAIFEKWYTNQLRVLHLDHTGSFGQPVKIAAKVDLSGMDTTNLCFYSYDKASNAYKRIADPGYWMDKSGYLHFTTELAGDIVISAGALVRK